MFWIPCVFLGDPQNAPHLCEIEMRIVSRGDPRKHDSHNAWEIQGFSHQERHVSQN